MSSSGGSQPVTFDAPGHGQQLGTGRGVEGGGDVVDRERALGAALDEAALTAPGPGQQHGVVLDDGGDDHVVGGQRQPVGEMVDGLGGVADDHGDVVAVLRAAGEAEGGQAGLLVGVGGQAGLVPRPPVHAGVPRQELLHALGHRRQGVGRGRRVEVQVRPLLPVDDRAPAGRRRRATRGHGVPSRHHPPRRRRAATETFRVPRGSPSGGGRPDTMGGHAEVIPSPRHGGGLHRRPRRPPGRAARRRCAATSRLHAERTRAGDDQRPWPARARPATPATAGRPGTPP